MPVSGNKCPICGSQESKPLIYGDLDMIDARLRATVMGENAVGGGNAVTIDSAGRFADRACLLCGPHWSGAWASPG